MASDIREWLEGLGLEKYAEAFIQHDVELQALLHLDQEDLKELGVSLGHRKLILAATSKLRADGDSAHRPEPSTASTETREDDVATGHQDAERRQLTVMFCDLVGSTELSRRLDPEDMREVLQRYQDAIASVVTRHDGHVAQFLGDGVLAYFGWPRAHEDQAVQAVRAGLAVMDALTSLSTPDGGVLRARVGIASGPVVVGDRAGDTARHAVTGETPNLAARLQGIAEPGQVVIGALTPQLLRNAFELEDLGTHSLKGMDEPVPVWRVAGEREVESRFEALGGHNTSPLIGRDHEIALVHDRYRLAASGEGQVMLLCGEPGIGKSRIVLELRERLLGQAYTPLRYFCSPFFANTVLHPILVQLEHAARLERADSAEEKLKKIKAVLADEPAPDQEAVHLLADLLSVPQTFERAADYTPQQRKAKTFTVFMRLLERLAARQPVLMALEDAQWLDPTSAELFELLIERMQTLPVFLVVTYRQPFAPPWLGYPHVTLLTLNRLGHDQGLRLVTHGAGGKPFPKQVMEQILAKAGGIPLFIEELTRNVLESGFLLEVGDRYELGEPLPPLAIPATLQDALVARLDRLSTAKDVAQTAACIGREVPYRLLRGIVGLDKAGLDLALGRLTASDVLVRRGIGDEALYVFRDSLMQETAHQTLLKSRRQVLHARIAKTLVEQMPSTAETTPEIVARHYTEAGLSGPAIEYWLKAARSAAAKPAFKEALAHLDNGLQLLSQVEDESRRTDREIELRLASGVALHALRGPVDEVREAYARVCALCQDVGDDRRLYAGLWGLWFNSEQRMDFEEAQRLAIQLLALAEREKDEELVVQAHHSAWTTYLYRGDLSRCMDHAEHGKRLYSSEHHHANSSVYSGHDAGVCCRYTAGLAAWLRGQPDTALDHAAESIVLAEKLAHPYSLALSLTISSLISQCRGEVARTLGFADRLRAVSEDNGIAVFRATADIMHGWGIAASGDPQSGVVAIERGVDALEHMGAGLRRSYFLWLLADAYALQGRNDLALDTLDRAHDFTRQRGEQWWQAEILRRQGELLPSSASVGAQRSAPLFQQAMSLAERQGALSLSLRAATSYAQFCIANGEVEKARGLVEPAYIRLREGRDTADLHNARTLVDRLSA